jgi:hypothetical protein
MMELGTQGIYLLAGLLEKERREILFHPVPREFDINPRVILVGKILP